MINPTLSRFSLLALLFGMGLSLSSCLKDTCEATTTYAAFEPVYVSADDFRQPIQAAAPRSLEEPGKIYVFQDYLFINERHKGIHVIDNSNPASPQPVSFIEIPGNVDMAVRGNLLYADNYVDVVSIDISNPAAPVFAGRSEAVIPHFGIDPELGFLVEYKETEITQEVECSAYAGSSFRDGTLIFIDMASNEFDIATTSAANDFSNGASQTGQGGSMARFTLAMDHLYIVDDNSLRVLALSTPERPELINTTGLGWGIETIFPLGDKLFIGSQTGMYIVDISTPSQPEYLSVFTHANACDPVYVDGDIAYVTLRDGTECQTFTNQLDVVDVSDLLSPRLIRSFDMHNPHGLSKSSDALFICENEQGVKVFDAAVVEEVGNRQIAHLKGFQAYDIITISSQKLAIVVGDDGLFQYDISNPEAPERLSNLMSL